MFYYGMTFKATDKLINEGWYKYEDEDEISQMFYCKSRKKINSIAEMQEHLRNEFRPSDEYDANLHNCLDDETIDALRDFFEIDAAEFESCCGCSTEGDSPFNYDEQAACPKCGSGNAVIETVQFGVNILVWYVCADCGCRFIDVYSYESKGILPEEE